MVLERVGELLLGLITERVLFRVPVNFVLEINNKGKGDALNKP